MALKLLLSMGFLLTFIDYSKNKKYFIREKYCGTHIKPRWYYYKQKDFMQRSCIIASAVGVTGIVVCGGYSIYIYYENLKNKRAIELLANNPPKNAVNVYDSYDATDHTNTDLLRPVLSAPMECEEDVSPTAVQLLVESKAVENSYWLQTKNMFIGAIVLNVVSMATCLYVYFH